MEYILNKVKAFRNDRRGNELVGGAWMMVMLFLFCASLIILLLYISRYSMVSASCSQMMRNMEVTGAYNKEAIEDALSARFATPVEVNAYYLTGTGGSTETIQNGVLDFKREFCLEVTASYTFPFFILGAGDTYISTWDIACAEVGMSEVYVKGK